MRSLLVLLLLASTTYAEHPLQPLVRLAEFRLKKLDAEVQDYTCKVVKRESVRGVLQPTEFMKAKIRPEPFALYVQYLYPERVQGRELLFVENQYDNKIIVKKGGQRFSFLTTSVSIDADVVKDASNHSIRDMGFTRLLKEMLAIAQEEMKHDHIQVKYYEGAKVEGRLSTLVEIRRTEPVKSEHEFHLVRLYIDDEMQLPIRFEAWDWPENGKLPLLEEFTLLEVAFNQGLGDSDFDYRNPNYGFNENYKVQ